MHSVQIARTPLARVVLVDSTGRKSICSHEVMHIVYYNWTHIAIEPIIIIQCVKGIFVKPILVPILVIVIIPSFFFWIRLDMEQRESRKDRTSLQEFSISLEDF